MGILGLEFFKTIVVLQINFLEFVSLQIFAENQKMSKFETKNASFGYF